MLQRGDFLISKIKDPHTSRKMISKLCLHPHSMVQHAILKREDVTPSMLKRMLDISKDERITSMRYHIINHKKMDEETLYTLSGYDNKQIVSLVLLTDKVSQRIIKKLQGSSDEEIRTMAQVRDPETDPVFIGRIIKKEFKKVERVTNDYIDRHYTIMKNYTINDILEAAIRNPELPTEQVELYKKCTKPVIISFVIPHPNISKALLDYYDKNGDEEVKEAIANRNKEQYTH